MFTNSNIQLSHTFTMIGFITEFKLRFTDDTRSNVFENAIPEMKVTV